MNGFWKYINKNTKKYKMIFRLVFLEYLMLRGLGNPCSTQTCLEMTSQKTAYALFYLFNYSGILVPMDVYKPVFP
jgi:hypothetical protein